MPSIGVPQLFLLLAVLYLAASLPLRDEDEMENFLTQLRQINTPWSLVGTPTDPLLEVQLRQVMSEGLDRRRQLGDIEFSNRYAEFLRSKAKHSSVCAFLRRMQGVKKSGLVAETEKVNHLLKQYMCPSIYSLMDL